MSSRRTPGRQCRPMTDMAKAPSTNPFVYHRLSFPGYYLHRPCLDTEWLLSTLFDASLLSTSKAAGNGGLFFAVIPGRVFASRESITTIGVYGFRACAKRRIPE